MWRKLFISLLLAAGLVLTGSGQSVPVKFTSLGTRDGLLSNSISAILKDRYGWMWFATNDGLNKYDGSNFTVYRHKAGDATSLRANEILALHEDKAGNLWVGTSGGAVSLYDRRKDVFINYPLGDSGVLSPSALVRSICSDGEGKIWLAQFEAPYVLDPATGRIERLDLLPYASNPFDKITLNCVFGDSRGRVWVGTDKGLFLYEAAVRRFRQFRHLSSDAGSLPDDDVRVLAEDRIGNLWIGTGKGLSRIKGDLSGIVSYGQESGTDRVLAGEPINAIAADKDGVLWVGTGEGLRVYDPGTGRAAAYLPEKGDPHSLTSGAIRCIDIDNQGIYWIGTFRGGVNKYDKNLNLFDGKLTGVFHEGGVESTVVTSFEERPDGNIWIGTDGGGLYDFDRKEGKLRRIPLSVGGKEMSLLSVLALMKRGGELYIGTWGEGLLIQDIATGRTRQLKKGMGTGDLNANEVYCISEDRDGEVWLGTNGSGVNILKNGRVVRRLTPHPSMAGDVLFQMNGYVRAIQEDRDGKMWIGTHGGGIAVYDGKAGRFEVFSQERGELPSDKIQSMLLDSKGRLWVGTYGGGLLRYDRVERRWVVYNEKDGLQNANVYQIVEDAAGLIWVATNTGISSLDPKDGVFRNFTALNGLQNNNFLHNSGIRTSDGELFFGGQQGFNYFYPASLTTNRNVPKVVLTDLKVANRSVVPGEGAPIREQISVAREVRLNYGQNVAISYVALNYTLPRQNMYAYKLDGLDKDWNYAGTQNTAYYTNLDPGEYVFRVKASNNDGVWSTADSSIRVYVKPPFWRTGYAYVFYFLLAGGLLLYSRHRGLARVKKRFALEQERQEVRRREEMDQLKLKFLTNLSHEFRTPISLIMGPVEQLISQRGEEGAGSGDGGRDKLQLIRRNGRRLLNLVNQLLDFRKMEEHELRLQLSEGELVGFVKEVCQSFADLSERKQIGFDVETKIERLYVRFDKDKVERILFNLLSNAFKFTLEGGRIRLLLGEEGEEGGGIRWVSLKVMDTGIGIPADKKEMIFERFFQNSPPGSILNPGTGIGLSITREFVRLHGGTIGVESEVDRGTVFTIRLPLEEAMGMGGAVLETVPAEVGGEEQGAAAGKPTLLLVEDNEDFRFYLKDNLKSRYFIVEASNGKEGWQKALASHPSLIVSDVSMPYVDGITFTRRLKGDRRTAHIPVILLTALTEQGTLLQGLDTGANDYITKPFDFEILHAKIRSLLGLSDSLKSTYMKRIDVSAAVETEGESADEKLMRQVAACIEANLDDPQLSVDFLTRELGMSRTSLYNKMLELTGQKPVEYIRGYKLEKAMVLLQRKD
ncbi:MAG: response regulator, partial [Bacteroidetes bacterium]|nr:response regulator [Bacteroidota bacterium]